MKTITGSNLDFLIGWVKSVGVNTARFRQSSLPEVVGEGSLPRTWSRKLLDGVQAEGMLMGTARTLTGWH